MDEQAAIVRMKAGDIGGLEPLVHTYGVRAMRAALLVCGDPALAEDVVQGAFLRAYARIASYDLNRPFGPWFLRLVVNEALQAGTRQARTAVREPSARLPPPDPPDPASGPEALLLAAETTAAVDAALACLAPEQRAAIVLRYYLGLSEVETAARLGAPLGTVKWRLHAARQRLRALVPAWLHPNAE